MNQENTPIVTLSCCCCGAYTKGRQWHNRDNGFGICGDCVKWMRETGDTAETMQSNYGTEGVHYNVTA